MNNGLEWKGSKTLNSEEIKNNIDSKEVNLCRGVAMISDAETLLVRALEAYENEELTAFESIYLQRGWDFLDEFKTLARKWDKALQNLYEMSDRDIMEIGYE